MEPAGAGAAEEGWGSLLLLQLNGCATAAADDAIGTAEGDALSSVG